MARRLIVVLGALSAFGPLSIDMYLPGLPSMTADLSAPASAAQLTVTACLIGLGVGQLFAGPISDARGRRPVLLVGLAAYVVASLACAAAPDVWVLIVVRFAQGMAGAFGIVLARAIVRDRVGGRGACPHVRGAVRDQRGGTGARADRRRARCCT